MLPRDLIIQPKFQLSFLAIVYLFFRYGSSSWLEFMGAYGSYILEAIVILLAFVIERKSLAGIFKVPLATVKFMILGLASGALVYVGLVQLRLPLPFAFDQLETLFFLLLIGPIIEELIFRFFLWRAFEKWNAKLALVVTSILFSFGHFYAYWLVDTQLHGFIFYQTAYTLFLAMACGAMILKYRSLTAAILLHMTFNLGFYLGWVILG